MEVNNMANKETLTQLVKSARSGNSQAINKLFESCYNDIYYFALKTVKNEDTAYDITQEACIEIFNGLPSLENESAFTTWSRQIAYRRCCRYFEKNRDVLVDEGDEENNIFDSVEDSDMDFIPDEALDRDDFRKTIMDMINALSEEQRDRVEYTALHFMMVRYTYFPKGDRGEKKELFDKITELRHRYGI